NEPLTANRLHARYSEISARVASRRLRALARAGLLSGTPNDGYTVTEQQFLPEWRAANPMLRHALRTNPQILPGGEKLGPLFRRRIISRGKDRRKGQQEARQAFDILRDLLAIGERVAFRHHSRGLVDDLKRAIWPGWRWWRGSLYVRRN